MVFSPAEYLTKEKILEMKTQLLGGGKTYEDKHPLLSDSEKWKKRFVWKRPQELSPSPKITVSGYENTNFIRGPEGNPYFISTLAAVARCSSLIDTIFPDGQNFEKDYCGLFYYRFWNEGAWVYVAIDDKILVDSNDNSFVFTSVSQKDEFWAILLEKAFAKYCGGYEEIIKVHDNLLLFLTGGITETIPIHYKDPDNFLELKKLCNSGAVIMAAFHSQLLDPENGTTSVETLSQERFTILGVTVVDLYNQLSNQKGAKNLYRLVKLKYPFGKLSWTPPWEKAATDWLNLSEELRKLYFLTTKNEAEFYLSYEDFKRGMTEVIMCTVPGCKTGWVNYSCSGYLSTLTFKQSKYGFDMNKFDTIKLQYFPQFKINAIDVFKENKVELLVSLYIVNLPSLYRQFVVYRLTPGDNLPLDQTFFAFNQPVYISRLNNATDIASRFHVEPGLYALVVVFERAKPIRCVLRVASLQYPKDLTCSATRTA